MADLAPDAVASTRDLLKERDYLAWWASRWCGGLGGQVESVALGWQMYALARRTHGVEQAAFLVGMIGLAAFIPILLLTLPAGEIADRHERRRILLVCLAGEMITAFVLTLAAWRGFATTTLLLAVAVAFGASRAFFTPANMALAPMLVPRPLLARAIAWNSLAGQSSAIAGPAIGGLLVALSPAHAYAAALALYAAAAICVALVRQDTRPAAQPGSRLALMKEGLVYVWRQKMVFGSISLDLFAVLLGGATALLPVFAHDVLDVGARGFGVLRAAPAAGATLVGVWLATRPIRRRAGAYLFGGVALFGLATCVFALSKALWLSVAALVVLGGADMLSVFVRQTLVQLVTPDALRGRASSVSWIFIGASNELGEFESGLAARFLGPVGAALFGGIGALAVTGIWAWLFPALRKADRLE